MKKEMLQLRFPDPEILEAHSVSRTLLWKFKTCTDPLTRQAVKGMVYDALEYEAELRLRSQAKDTVEMLHNLQNPNVNQN